MRRLGLPLAAALAAAAVPAALAPLPAAADPFTGAFQDLLVELNARDDALPPTGLTPQQRKEARALAKAFRALGSDSEDVAGDLRIAGKMAKALEAGYPGDPTLEGIFDELLDALEAGVRAGRDELEAALESLLEGKFKDKAAAALADADGALLLAEGAATAVLRAKGLGRAEALVRKGLAAAAKADPGDGGGGSSMAATVRGAPWAANSDFGTAVGGIATVSEAGGLRNLLVRGRRILPKTGNPQQPGASSTLDLLIDAVTANIGTGTYPVGNTGGYGTGATFMEEDEDGDISVAVAESGTVTLDAIDIKLGSVTVSGTFSLTLRDGASGNTFTIVSGTFVAENLPRTGEP